MSIPMRRIVTTRAQVHSTVSVAGQGLRTWGPRQVLTAVASAMIVAAVIGVPTVLIPNPLFGRDIPPVAWNYPVWILTSVLVGMLIATYVNPAAPAQHGSADSGERRSNRLGVAGGALTWFAVGCPVCNKIALLALGYSGAITWFAPVQPFLAAAALTFSAAALVLRLGGQVACAWPRSANTSDHSEDNGKRKRVTAQA